MADFENSREEMRESSYSGAPDDQFQVSLKDMQSFAAIVSSHDSAANPKGGELGNLDIVSIIKPSNNRPESLYPQDRQYPFPERPYKEPRELNEAEYKKLADEIKNTGKIPKDLKDALERTNGDRLIDLDRLNGLIKGAGMKLDLIPMPDGRQRLDLIKGGQVIDSVKQTLPGGLLPNGVLPNDFLPIVPKPNGNPENPAPENPVPAQPGKDSTVPHHEPDEDPARVTRT